MNKSMMLLAVAVATAMAVAGKGNAGDEVLMTINKKPVTLGEFEYLYHKNQSQQVAPQTIEEYLDMFVTYKQKVAAAEAEGIDRTEAFRNEFDGYRRDLSEPYLEVKEVEDSLVNAIYERMKTEVDVSHIMLASRGKGVDPQAQRQRLDSIRTALLAGADFAQLAQRFSIDPGVSRNSGHMGYITAGVYPYVFEDAAYTTPVGQISPVIETPFGFHIVKVHNVRPASGQVLVEHILKLTQGLSPEAAEHKRMQTDSLRTLLVAGADFAEMAARESEDPGSKRNGGKLPWFGINQMVPEFEHAAYALKKGEISEPVKTAYGYHIIHKLDSRGIDTKEALTPNIKKVIASDERSTWPRKRKLEQLKALYGAKPDIRNLDVIESEIVNNGGLDSTLMARYITDNRTVAVVDKQEIPLSEIVSETTAPYVGSATNQAAAFRQNVMNTLDAAVIEAERNNLAATNADYRNLLNEYRDGMLLFEVSDRNVWTRAKQDKEGLENYFRTHRDAYAWDKPRFKSFIVFANSDSVSQAAKAYLDANPQPADSVVTALRRQFGKDIKVERVIAAKGDNPITDYLAFGGEKPQPKTKWAFYFPYLAKILDNPEEAADVRGAVTGDYQNYLEEQWVAELKKQYPAKINKKVLKKAK